MTRRWGQTLALAIYLWPAPVAAQISSGHRLAGGGGADVSIGRLIVSLVICIIIAVLAVLLIRQRSGKSDLTALFSRIDASTRAIDIVETRRMSPHADACLLRHRNREYLVVVQPNNVVVLRDEPVAPADAPCV